MRIIKNLLAVGVVGVVVMLLLSLLNKPKSSQPGTALDNINFGSWQWIFSLPYQAAHSVGLIPDLPQIGAPIPPGGGPVFDVGGGLKVPPPDPTGSIPDAQLYPGEGYTNA